MYCQNCGTQLSDDANFCMKCGKPQKPDSQVDESKWETCEIVFELISAGGLLSKARMKFWADAIGQIGSFNAGSSAPFDYYLTSPSSSDQQTLNTHRDFIKQLVADGWESIGDRGNSWWSHRFRRKSIARPVEEKNFFDLILLNSGRNKIETIKVIRNLIKLGLGEAKMLSETPNGVILRNVDKSTALHAQSLFERAGAPTKIV